MDTVYLIANDGRTVVVDADVLKVSTTLYNMYKNAIRSPIHGGYEIQTTYSYMMLSYLQQHGYEIINQLRRD